MAKDKDREKVEGETIPAGDEKEPVFISLSPQDLINLLRESRKDPEAEAKIAEEAKRVLARRNRMIQLAKQDDLARARRQETCGHRKPDQQESSAMQEFSDGVTRVFCLRCQKVLRTYWNPAIRQGMALQEKMQALGITEAELNDLVAKGNGGEVAVAPPPDDFALGMPRTVAPAVQTTQVGRH